MGWPPSMGVVLPHPPIENDVEVRGVPVDSP